MNVLFYNIFKRFPIKYLILVLLFSTLLISSTIENDKRKHFEYSSVISFNISQYLIIQGEEKNRIIKSISYSMIPGIIKEISDSKETNNRFDEKDLMYDFLGAVTGTFLSQYINNNIKLSTNKERDFLISYNFKF